eukprot:scaffold1830_cov246-Pinguiococcus_pyrenoidosus.AAC.8
MDGVVIERRRSDSARMPCSFFQRFRSTFRVGDPHLEPRCFNQLGYYGCCSQKDSYRQPRSAPWAPTSGTLFAELLGLGSSQGGWAQRCAASCVNPWAPCLSILVTPLGNLSAGARSTTGVLKASAAAPSVDPCAVLCAARIRSFSEILVPLATSCEAGWRLPLITPAFRFEAVLFSTVCTWAPDGSELCSRDVNLSSPKAARSRCRDRRECSRPIAERAWQCCAMSRVRSSTR